MPLAKSKGIDPTYYNRIAQAESSNNPNARNPIKGQTASGLYQFTEGTWKSMVGQLGLDYSLDDRFDPNKSKVVMEAFTKQNTSILQKKLGRELNDIDLYAAHFLGVGRASQWLKNVNNDPKGKPQLPDDYLQANKGVFYKKDGVLRTNQEIYNELARRLNNKPRTENKSDYKEVTTPNIYTDITNFDTPTQTNTFVPIEQEESKTKEEIAVEQKTNEYNLLKDFQLGKIQIQPTQQRPQQTEVPQIDVMQQYAEISNLVEQGREGGFFEGWSFNTMQKGGKINQNSSKHFVNLGKTTQGVNFTYKGQNLNIPFLKSLPRQNEDLDIKREVFNIQQMTPMEVTQQDFNLQSEVAEIKNYPQQPRYYNIEDTNKQNFGGGSSKYKIDNLNELRDIPKEMWDRKITPIYSETEWKNNLYNSLNNSDFSLMQDGGEIKTTPYGQYQYPGEITKIPSNNITMKGVSQALLGITDTGEERVMIPEEDYIFKGATEVTEIPLSFKELYKLKTGKELK